MNDLIRRQDAIDAILGITPIQNTIPLDSAIFNIKKLPSAQKRGEWKDIHAKVGTCSVCGCRTNLWNYCPNCGADMKGERDERIN